MQRERPGVRLRIQSGAMMVASGQAGCGRHICDDYHVGSSGSSSSTSGGGGGRHSEEFADPATAVLLHTLHVFLLWRPNAGLFGAAAAFCCCSS